MRHRCDRRDTNYRHRRRPPDDTIGQHNPGVTEFAEVPARGHSLTIDDGWAEVAQTSLTFIKRFT